MKHSEYEMLVVVRETIFIETLQKNYKQKSTTLNLYKKIKAPK